MKNAHMLVHFLSIKINSFSCWTHKMILWVKNFLLKVGVNLKAK